MKIGELAARAGVTTKTVRYYESLRLLVPARLSNGYRDYDEHDVRAVQEVRSLSLLGIPVERTRPFLECLAAGRAHGDDCPASLVTYRNAITELTERIEALAAKRAALVTHLREAAHRASAVRAPEDERTVMTNLNQLPADLPVPEDDGAAEQLSGRPIPHLSLPTTSGRTVALDDLGPGRTVLYIYPLTGRPDVDLPDGWDNIPGARGCTTEACDFRDHYSELLDAGTSAVFGLSGQAGNYQREVVDRLGLPFDMLSDIELSLADKLNLPTFHAGGRTLYKRLTLVISDGAIEHVFYPIFPPNQHAQQVLAWLRSHPAGPRFQYGGSVPPTDAAGLGEQDVDAAAARIAPYARRTPTWRVDVCGRPVVLKLEHHQLGGSFKLRGALSALTAGPQPEHVVTASGGNHGVAVATAAALLGLPATVVVPAGAPAGKTRRIEGAGADLVIAGATYADAAATAAELAARPGWRYLPAFDDPAVIAGQATATAELVADAPDVDTIAVAAGGGGLAAGACLAAGARTVVTVEPEHCCCVANALAAGHPVDSPVESIAASGLGATRVGNIPFGILRDRRTPSLRVSEHDIIAARDELWEQLRIAVEPAGATAYAAFHTGRLPGNHPAVILSGANTDWTPH